MTTPFQTRLKEIGIDPIWYLEEAKKRAKQSLALNWKTLTWSHRKGKKLSILNDNGKSISFGSSINNDFIIWSELERRGEVPQYYASRKRQVFWKSHTAMKNWNPTDSYSPNTLSLIILW